MRHSPFLGIDAMDLEEVQVNPTLLAQADMVLSHCGRPQFPDGLSCVPIPKSFLMPLVLQPGQSQIFTKEITGETNWALRAISCDQGMNSLKGVRLQIQLPNGRFLIAGNGEDVGQFTWVGSYRYLMDPELDCEPGTTIKVTLSDTSGLGAAFVCNLLFEGAYKYYVRDGQPVSVPMNLASSMPRYFGNLNENILAPCWLSGIGPSIPADCELFMYASGTPGVYAPATVPLAGPTGTTLKIQMDAGRDFFVTRILVAVGGDATVTAASFVGRLRAGTGFALNDNLIDLARYLGGAEFVKLWRIQGGDEVVIDLNLVDQAGTGNATIQVFLEGARRRLGSA